MQLYVAARDALKMAKDEARRQIATEEKAELVRVARAIRNLRDAIARATLPRAATAHSLAGDGGRLPDVEVFVGWSHAPRVQGSYRLTISDVLSIAEEMLRRHQDSLPRRAAIRHRPQRAGGDAQAVAFVRWLAYHARQALPSQTLAAWCAVALGPTCGVTARRVTDILRRAA